MAEVGVAWKVAGVHGEPRPWTSKQGQDNLSYTVSLEGYERNVEVSRWATKAAPQVGEEMYGYIEENATNPDYKPKFKKVQQGGGFSGGGGKSPEQQKSIVRQHSQEMALRALTLRVRAGEALGSGPEFWEMLKKATEWFVKDAGE